MSRNFLRNNNKENWYIARRSIVKYVRVARRVANFAILHKNAKVTSSKVKHLGKLPAAIANQIILKYKNNKRCKKISNVNLVVPACSTVKYPSVIHDKTQEILTIKPLKLKLRWHCPIDYLKINQVEINKDYCYICVTVENCEKTKYEHNIGIDLNLKHNLATVGNPITKEHQFLGRGYIYERVKFKEMRRRYQKQGRLNRVKLMGNKEQRVMNNLNHRLTHQILEIAKSQQANIKIEDLTGIRSAQCNKGFKYFLHSWQFFRMRTFLEYKARIRYSCIVGAINPKYTSQDCSNCGHRNKCNGKHYVCKNCGLKIHRDVNASFNIANRSEDYTPEPEVEMNQIKIKAPIVRLKATYKAVKVV